MPWLDVVQRLGLADAERQRASVFEPLLEVMDPPAYIQIQSVDLETPNLALIAMEDALSRRDPRATHDARVWAWWHRQDVGPLLDSPNVAPRVAWTALCHLKRTPEQQARAGRIIEHAVRHVRARGDADARDEARQEARIRLFEHVLQDRFPGWRPGYLETAVRNAFYTAINKHNAETSKLAAEDRELAEDEVLVRAHGATTPASPDAADVVIDSMSAEELVHLIERLRSLLTPRETQVLDGRLQGFDDAEIAERFGTTTQSVNTLGRRIAAKARGLF